MSKVSTAVPKQVGRRGPGPLRISFTRAVQDWWYGLIPFAAINLLWLILVVTVVAGPPATAAMMGVARDAAIGEGAEPKNFFRYIKEFFWRAWKLGLVTALGTLILYTDVQFYSALMKGNTLLLDTGVWFLFYIFVVWVEFLLIAWATLVNQPQMSIRNVLRNSGVVTLKTPGANLGLALLVLLVCVFSFVLTIGVSLAMAAIVALLVQHYVSVQAPILADFPPRPEEVPSEIEAQN